MKTSAQGRALIEEFEGRYLKAYHDSVGVLTVGYGHTSAAGEPYVQVGMTITEDEADRILPTGNGAHNNVQPSIIVNYIMRVI